VGEVLRGDVGWLATALTATDCVTCQQDADGRRSVVVSMMVVQRSPAGCVVAPMSHAAGACLPST